VDKSDDLVTAVARALSKAQSALFITGAGLSADSGLPTYRGIGGLYEDSGTEEGLAIEDALSGRMMETRPEVCWKYIHQIESACRGAGPNRGHEVMAELEGRMNRVWVLTQNVDALHRRAGSQNVIEVHGDVHRLMCTKCSYRDTVEDYAGLDTPPLCPECGAVVRPEVVLFGEMLPGAAMRSLARVLAQGFDVVLSVGTSSLFPYIAHPVMVARAMGRATVEINPGETPVSRIVNHRLQEGAARALDKVLARYLELAAPS